MIIVFTVLLALALLTVGLRLSGEDIAGYIELVLPALVLAVRLRFSLVGVASVVLSGTGLLIRDREGEVI